MSDDSGSNKSKNTPETEGVDVITETKTNSSTPTCTCAFTVHASTPTGVTPSQSLSNQLSENGFGFGSALLRIGDVSFVSLLEGLLGGDNQRLAAAPDAMKDAATRAILSFLEAVVGGATHLFEAYKTSPEMRFLVLRVLLQREIVHLTDSNPRAQAIVKELVGNAELEKAWTEYFDVALGEQAESRRELLADTLQQACEATGAVSSNKTSRRVN